MSINAATLRRLATLNLAPEQMAGVLDILADIQAADEGRKAGQRERTRKHREQRDRNVTVTEVKRDGDVTPPLKKVSPEPPSKNNPLPSSEPDGSSVRTERAGRGSRVDGFEPDIEVATGMGMSPPQARLNAEKFVDFWRGKAGKDGVKLDWPATWRNWIRGSLERDGPRLVHARDRPPPQEHMRDRLKRTILEDQPDVRPFADHSTIEGQAYRR